MKKLVEMRGITKIFPGVTANDRVDFDLDEGEIHALLGENGSGKSTLMNILAGFYRPDTGEIRIKGKKVNLRSPGDALSLGIGMVYQHFRLVENFTVAENIILGMSKGGIWLNYRRLHEKIAQLAATMGLPVNPAARIWQLSVGERQRVEILKVLWREAQIIILDEPTAVLTPQEAGELFAGLKRLKESGCVIVLISHKLQEALTVADRVTVLRRGKKVATLPNQGLNAKALSLLMIGREVAFQAGKQTLPGTEAVINLAQVSATGDSGIPALKKVSLVVHAGEILGIAGIAGNGQKELAEAASGLRRVSSGKILIGGQDLTQKGVAGFIAAGVSYIPEDRLGTGIAPNLGVIDNLLLRRQHLPFLAGRFFLKRKSLQREAEQLVQNYDIRMVNLNRPVKVLSGGNIQKLILAREMSTSPGLIVASHPTRGLDVGAAATIRRLLLERRAAGGAILLISEDLEEIFQLSDRISILYEGRIMGTYPVEQINPETAGLLMMGLRPSGSQKELGSCE